MQKAKLIIIIVLLAEMTLAVIGYDLLSPYIIETVPPLYRGLAVGLMVGWFVRIAYQNLKNIWLRRKVDRFMAGEGPDTLET